MMNLGKRIIIIGKNDPTRTMLKYVMEMDGFFVQESDNISDGIHLINRQKIDIAIVEHSYLQDNAIHFQKLKQRYGHPIHKTRPIIVIFPENANINEFKITGFDESLDKKIQQPFLPAELITQLKSIINNPNFCKSENHISIAGISINPKQKDVNFDGENVNLGHIEYQLLLFFMTHPNAIYTRQQILSEVWGDGKIVDERTVDVHIRKLRKVMQRTGHDQLLQTVHGAGYRFITQVLEVL